MATILAPQRPTFVIVDDVALVRLVLRLDLYKVCPDAVVFAAASVEAARKVLTERDATAIIADYYLGDGTGLELVDRAHQRATPIPVVVMSIDPQIKEMALAAGAAGFLLKPYDLAHLAAVVTELSALVPA